MSEMIVHYSSSLEFIEISCHILISDNSVIIPLQPYEAGHHPTKRNETKRNETKRNVML